MRFSDLEINSAVRHLCAVGYRLLSRKERHIIDVLCAVC